MFKKMDVDDRKKRKGGSSNRDLLCRWEWEEMYREGRSEGRRRNTLQG